MMSCRSVHVVVVMVGVLGWWRAGAGGSDLYLSTAETALLLDSEPELLGMVHRYVTQAAHTTGSAEFTRLARELQGDLNRVPRGQDAGHPVDAYVGLRRFTGYWARYIARLGPALAASVERSLAQNHMVYPDHTVLQQARRAIVRLQAAYHLPPAALLTTAAAGNLTGEDLAAMAGAAEGLGFPDLAEGWRSVAVSLLPSSELPLSTESGHTRPSEVDSEVEETRTHHRHHAKFFSLCQHFRNSTDLSALSSEHCRYSQGRSAPLSRWRTEVLSTDPPVVLYYDFLTDREAAIMTGRAVNNLEQAHTRPASGRSGLRVHHRLGKTAWLQDARSRTLQRVARRIEQATGLHAAFRPQRSFGEHFQVVNYGIGGHYIPHYDYFKARDAFTEAEEYLKDSGDRAATFMIYLGDVTEGGATVFPRLGIGAPPVKVRHALSRQPSQHTGGRKGLIGPQCSPGWALAHRQSRLGIGAPPVKVRHALSRQPSQHTGDRIKGVNWSTVFPRLGIGTPPVKRAALFWHNFTPDGLPDRRSLHGGCPVIIGQKWVANKWIHEIGTAMTKSCQTKPWKPANP
ncbi:hypothetical protein ACOMHN_002643 [Nucella lapillus]